MNWKTYKSMLMPDSDPREKILLTAECRRALFSAHKSAILLRYTTDFDTASDSKWYYCIKDSAFDMEALKSKRRNVIKKGIANFTVREINLMNYVDQFHVLLNDAFQAYTNPPTWSYERCKHQCEEMCIRESSVVFGAFPNGEDKLVGYLWLDIQGRCIHMIAQHVMRDYEKAGCNAAIDHAMCVWYTQEYYPRGYYLCDGEKAIIHETSFQDYLIKYFGFRYAPCNLHVYLNPRYAWLVKMALAALPLYGWLLSKCKPNLYKNLVGIQKLRGMSVK